MRLYFSLTFLASSIILTSCAHRGTNPEDPYEPINRKIHAFNTAFDATLLKPAAKLYKTVIPAGIRTGINHFYTNIYLIPTIGNDLLQKKWRYASDDAGRFFINSTIGIGGIFDVATRSNLPLHRNDLGLTFAQWGDKKSPYIVIPFLGPSTIRDGMAITFEYVAMTPYPWIRNDTVLNTLIGVRYVDLRSQYLETDRFIDEALDKYSFIRDAYLQNRHYLITGEQPATETSPDAGTGINPTDDNNGYVDE